MLGGNLALRHPVAWLMAVVCVSAVRSSFAVQVEFDLVGPNSLTAAPFVNAVGAPMTGQDPSNASLTTTYSGTVTVDVDDLMNPTSIAFVSASAIAANSGDWLPEIGGGTEGDPMVEGDANPGTPMPANYGFFVDLGVIGRAYAASRDSIWSLNAAARPVTGGQFDPFGIGIEVAQGTYHVNLSSIVYGDGGESDDLTGETGSNCTNEAGSVNRCGANMGSYAVANDLATLTLPLDFIISEGGDPEVRFTGTLTATYSLEQPLLGDYNGDGAVNAADYVMGRDQGPTGFHTDFFNNFGGTSGVGVAATVPEPTAGMLASLGLVGLLLHWRSLRQRIPVANSKRYKWNHG